MIFVRMREDHPFEPGEVDLKLCDLPEGVRTEIDHGVGVDKVTAPAAELFAAQLFRPGAERALTPESRNASAAAVPRNVTFIVNGFSFFEIAVALQYTPDERKAIPQNIFPVFSSPEPVPHNRRRCVGFRSDWEA